MVLYNAAIVRRSAPPEHQPAPQLEALSALDWIGGCYNKGHLLWFCNLSIALKCHIVHRQWIAHQRYKWRCCGATDCVNTRKTHWSWSFFVSFFLFERYRWRCVDVILQLFGLQHFLAIAIKKICRMNSTHWQLCIWILVIQPMKYKKNFQTGFLLQFVLGSFKPLWLPSSIKRDKTTQNNS